MIDDYESSDEKDQVWMENIRQNDEQSFEFLFKKYYLPLTRFAWRYVGSKAVAEELVQELFTTVWEQNDNNRSIGSVRSYLYKSIRNLSINYLKHEDVKNRYDEQWFRQRKNPKIDYNDEIREQQIREAIVTAVDDLPPRSKMTYKLHRYDGLTYQEIAEIMDVSIKTVESQMTRTLKTLRERLSYLLPLLIFVLMAV